MGEPAGHPISALCGVVLKGRLGSNLLIREQRRERPESALLSHRG
jgi:hypothetical protein